MKLGHFILLFAVVAVIATGVWAQTPRPPGFSGTAKGIFYDPADSNLSSTDVQEAIDELADATITGGAGSGTEIQINSLGIESAMNFRCAEDSGDGVTCDTGTANTVVLGLETDVAREGTPFDNNECVEVNGSGLLTTSGAACTPGAEFARIGTPWIQGHCVEAEDGTNRVQTTGTTCGTGGSSSNPYLSGSRLTDAGIEYIYDLKEFGGLRSSDFRAHYYFSSFRGSDANPCSREEPCRTMAKANEICTSWSRCTFAPDVWTPILIEITTTAASGELIPGETFSSDAGTDGVVLAVDYGGYTECSGCRGVVAVRMDGNGLAAPDADPVATDVLTGDQSGATVTVGAVVDVIGSDLWDDADFDHDGGTDFWKTDCGDGDAACIVLEGTSREEPAWIDCNHKQMEDSGSSHITLLGNTQDVTDRSGGWLAVQNWIVSYCDNDVIGTSAGAGISAQVVALNIRGDHILNRAATSQNHNIITGHDRSVVIGLNVSGTVETISTSGSGAPVAWSGLQEAGILIGKGHLVSITMDDSPLADVAAWANSGAHSFTLGHTLRSTGLGRGNAMQWAVGAGADASRDFSTKIVRVAAESFYANNRAAISYALNSAATGSHTLDIWEGFLAGFRCLVIGELFGATIDMVVRGTVLDECLQWTFMDAGSDSNNKNDFTLDIQGGYDPEDDGGVADSLCCEAAGGSCTSGDTPSECTSLFPGKLFWASNSFDSGGSSNEVAWSQSGQVDETISVTFADANPDTITRGSGDFTTNFVAGRRYRVGDLLTTVRGDDQTFRVTNVATTVLTLHRDDQVLAQGPGNFDFMEYTNNDFAVHVDSNMYGQSIGTYTTSFGPSTMTIPEWVTSFGVEIDGVSLTGAVGGR